MGSGSLPLGCAITLARNLSGTRYTSVQANQAALSKRAGKTGSCWLTLHASVWLHKRFLTSRRVGIVNYLRRRFDGVP